MYLPSFYKLKFEKYFFNTRRAAPFALPALIWGKHLSYLVTWTFWPQIYNTIYTDFIPPKRGVERRIHTDE